MAPVLIISGIVLLVVIGIAVSFNLEKKRTDALSAVARSMKLEFMKKDNSGLLAAYSGFHLFSQGHSRKISNIMQGTSNDVDLHIFDYKYTTGHGKNSHTWRQTMIAFRSEKLQLPTFSLRPEHLFHKIGGVFGYQDIDFDENPEFSKHYLLRGENENAIRSCFGRDVLSYYERHRGLITEGAGDQVIFCRRSKRIAPDKMKPFMEEGFAVFGLFAKGG